IPAEAPVTMATFRVSGGDSDMAVGVSSVGGADWGREQTTRKYSDPHLGRRVVHPLWLTLPSPR
ncbi:MAG: hypothetical protein OXU39_13675, partial [Gemmatimonadota bacterium]|nr:hypothetical protein [Gemmatimonadota bacterium]